MKTTWTLDELKASLQDFDKKHGGYPEHESEGFAVWLWLTTGEVDPEHGAETAWWNDISPDTVAKP